MIDFHSHILPAVDDGSKDVDESILMLKMLADQGVSTVIATPHFYADYEKSVDDFIERRNKAFDELRNHLSDDLPKIICGAEVSYYPGISRMEEIKRLRIEGSRLLLLEMPMCRWSAYTVKELIEFSNSGKVKLVIAHMDRYMGFQKKDTLFRLYENGVLMQMNASFFTGFTTKRKAISMLADGQVNFIGSDCHNITSRPPRIGDAFIIIRKKLGEDFVSRVNEYGYSMLYK